MYIFGTRKTFENRLHQLPRTLEDLTNFIAEGDEYYFTISAQERWHWEREARRWKYMFTHNPADLSTQLFGLPEIDAILDENSNVLFDEVGNIINIILEEY